MNNEAESPNDLTIEDLMGKEAVEAERRKAKERAEAEHTESSLIELLKLRYDPIEWMLIPHVRADSGFARPGSKMRTADAIALGLWASRGHPLVGHEIKVSRSDWKKELSQPEKSAAIQQYCDAWWVVAPSTKIVDPDELPKTWGLLVVKGPCLKVARQAPKLDPKPPPLGFMVMMMRAFSKYETPESIVRRKIEDARSEGYKAGTESEKHRQTYELENLQKEAKRNRERLQDFEKAHAAALKIGLSYYDEPEKTRAIVDALREFSADSTWLGARLKKAREAAERLLEVSKCAEAAAAAFHEKKPGTGGQP